MSPAGSEVSKKLKEQKVRCIVREEEEAREDVSNATHREDARTVVDPCRLLIETPIT